MADGDAGYTVVSQVHGNVLQDNGNVVSGYTINVRDNETGVTFPVFLADDKYNADNARTQILFQLDHIRQVHNLSN